MAREYNSRAEKEPLAEAVFRPSEKTFSFLYRKKIEDFLLFLIPKALATLSLALS